MAVTLGAAAIAAGGAYLAARSANNASKHAASISAKSTADALAFEKEQNQYVRSRYEKQDAQEDEARKLYQQYLAANGKGPAPGGNGVAIPNLMQGHGAIAGGGTPTIRDMAPMGAAAGPAPAPALTVADGPVSAASGGDVSTMPTIADTGRWNEWDPYLRQNQPA